MNGSPDPLVPNEEDSKSLDAANLCLLLGQMLFNFGATAQRIQDSISWLARHLGCKVDMLVSYDALLVTIADGATFRTRIDSSRRFAGLNLLGLTRLSAWLRGPPDCSSRSKEASSRQVLIGLEQALLVIRDSPPIHSAGFQSLAAGCAGAAFCVLNGGDPWSCGCSFLAAAAIFAIRRLLTARNFNVHLTIFAVAVAGSLLAAVLARLTHTATPLITLVAPLLFLVPGVPMINGGIDIIRNHVTIGVARVGFTLAVLGDLCLGVGLTYSLLPSTINPPFPLAGGWDIALVSLAGALAAGALGCLNNGGFPLMALCALGGLIGRLARAILSLRGFDLITASLIGVFCSTIIVGFIAEKLRWPAVIISVIAALPMVPGYFAIAGLNSLLRFAASSAADPAQLSIGVQALSRALFISVALVVGVIGPVIIVQRNKERV